MLLVGWFMPREVAMRDGKRRLIDEEIWLILHGAICPAESNRQGSVKFEGRPKTWEQISSESLVDEQNHSMNFSESLKSISRSLSSSLNHFEFPSSEIPSELAEQSTRHTRNFHYHRLERVGKSRLIESDGGRERAESLKLLTPTQAVNIASRCEALPDPI